MMRRVALAGIIATALPVLLFAGPASASGPNVGCLGPSCSVSLTSFIHLSGDYTSGTGSAAVPVYVPPPPCLWEPIGGTIAGAQYIISNNPGITKATDYLGIYESVQQAKQQLKAGGPPGTWYLLPINPAASPAAREECLTQIPLYAWVPPGGTPPTPPIPPRILAAYAYNHMTIPQPTLTTNPARKGYVNLATYVWANWAGQAGTVTQRANPNGTYSVTATLGNQSATVWAQPASGFTVHVAGPGTPYSAGCGIDGSKYPVGKAPAGAGPGQAPDCGALWRATTTGATITATVTFNVSWGAGILHGPGPNRLPQIHITSRPVTQPVAQVEGLNG